jgi:leader peptidase (prepilin peptidase)/N-methyltransferase
VEATTGILFVLAWRRFDTLVEVLAAILFCCLMVVLALVDLDHRALPDELTLPSIGLGLLAVGFGAGFSVFERVVAALVGWVVLTSASRAWKVWRGEPGLGEGDGRMLAGIGAFLGLEGLWLTLTLACAVASASWLLATGIAPLARRGLLGSAVRRFAQAAEVRNRGLPFGTFLAVAALLVLFSEGGFR